MKNPQLWIKFLAWKDSLAIRRAAFLQRRPHRSFKRTLRRDYARSLKLPGYWNFTVSVWLTLWCNKKIFIAMVVLYAFLAVLLGGITNQESYQKINEMVNQSAGEIINGTWATVGQAGLLLVSAFASPPSSSPEVQVILSLIGLMVWMTTVWLLRDIMAGRKPKLRDGIYNSGAPIVPTILLALVAAVQLIPVGIAALVYAGLSTVGLLQEGLGMMLFGVFAALVLALTLYWMTATFLSLAIVTLPGMYPVRALKAASDVVVGRRLRILYRILWLFFTIIATWLLVMIPIVLLDTGLKNLWPNISGLPIVPLMASIMSSLTLLWSSAYIYMLYRRIIADDASPA